MPAKCTPKTQKTSSSATTARSRAMVDDDRPSRKRSVTVSSDSSSDIEVVRSSPTKKFKKAIPGSPEYNAQPPVVVTSKTPKTIGRKLSFGSIDEDTSIHDTANLRGEGLASPISAREKRIRKPTWKATTTALIHDEDDDDVPLANKKRQTSVKKKGVDQNQKDDPKSSARKSTRQAPSSPVMEAEANVDSNPSPQKSKGKSRARSASPVNVSSDDDASIECQTPTKRKGVDQNHKDDPKPSARKSTRQAPSSPVVKAEPGSDGLSSLQKSKGKSRARSASPMDVPGDGDGDGFVNSGADKTPKARKTLLTKASEHDPAAAPAVGKASIDLPSAPLPTKVREELDVSLICTIHPSDHTRAPAYAPKDLRDLVSDGPIFLQPDSFESMFEQSVLKSLRAAVGFKSFSPFVNFSSISLNDLLVHPDYKNLAWSGSRSNAVCTMLGAVSSCNIVDWTMIGNYKYHAVTIIPYAPSFNDFMVLLGAKYSSSVFGPLEYGCLLTFSSRREGLSSTYRPSQSAVPSTTKHNMKAFGSRTNIPAAAMWFEKQFPPFIDFDQDIPIYDARSSPFMFTKDDFTGLPSLPLFKCAGENQRIADLPPNALVTIFFTMNTYSTTRVPPTPSGSGSPSKVDASLGQNNDMPKAGLAKVLSLNLQFLVYHSQIPEDD